MDSIDGMVEAYDTRTGVVHRVPPHFLGDPMVGRFLVKTPGQRVLDGELQPPTAESKAEEIRDFAAAADIDVTGLRKKDELLDAVNAALGVGPEEPVLPTEPDPNAPNPDSDVTAASDQTPATGE